MRSPRSTPGLKSLRDLQAALTAILDCFRVGRSSLWSTLFSPRADRILFAATKADHLHHSAHDRLEAILRRMVQRAIDRAGGAGAEIDVVALAAVRATREADVRSDGGLLPAIVGTAAPGERIDGRVFDGETEVAMFPGDLPGEDVDLFAPDAPGFRGLAQAQAGDPAGETDYRFVRLRPPPLERADDGAPALPHIRLDRALQFLIGDRLR